MARRVSFRPSLFAAATAILVVAGCGPQQTSSVSTEPDPTVGASSASASDSGESQEIKQHRFLGDQYLSSGSPLKAAEEYRKALEIDDGNAELYPLLGYAYLQADSLNLAVKSYQRYVALEPENCDAHGNLGFAYLKQGLTDQAIVSYEKALTLCPEDPNAYSNLGKAYQTGGDTIEAIEAFRRAVELNPDDIATFELLAGIYYDRKLYPESIVTYEAILANPNHGKAPEWVTWANGRLAYMYRWAGAWEKAIPCYKHVYDDPSVAAKTRLQAVRGLAVAYDKTDQDDDAIIWYQNLVEGDPDKPTYYYRLGELLNDVGRYKEAVSRVKEGQSYDTGCGARAFCALGTAYEKQKEYGRAKRQFQQAMKCNDPNYSSYAAKEIDRQDKFIKIEELKGQKEKYGY
jgi:tetratricopeptide (TPR) repeat protein